jgi:carbamoyltransferase
MIVLGIWDGHNSSASLIENGRIVAAVNEERFTKRKLEPLFPKNSTKYCLSHLNLKPKDIEHIAFSTSDFSLTLTRLFPKIKNDYWSVRRHKTNKPKNWEMDRNILNNTGKIKSNVFFRKVSKYAIKKYLSKLGFDMNKTKLYLVDHHKSHAASTYFTSGFKKSTAITLDALGDGYSSTINKCENGSIKTITKNKTQGSLGLFFQEVTSLCGMRVLEDEGKVMALSDYAYKNKNITNKNPLRKLFNINQTKIRSNFSLNKRYKILNNLLWRNKLENFCYMAQDALEHFSTQLVGNSVDETGINDISLAGGITSNIKMNMKIRQLKKVKNWHVFPDMGDGGLSAGAALYVSNKLFGTMPYKIDNMSLGPEFNSNEIENILKKYKDKINYEKREDVSKLAGELVSNENIVFWFQGRTEYGPRALGNRSILANASSIKAKNDLNMKIKQRSFYQPFCPSILESDANKFINEPKAQYNKFMTMGYMLKQKVIDNALSAMNIDNSIRPQMVGSENKKYMDYLKTIKKETGYGITLNTSFNIHGRPIVLDPDDAIKTQLETKNKHMVIGNYYVKLK